METKAFPLRQLVQSVADARVVRAGDVAVTGVAYDSREVKPGDLFICVKGFVYDGHEFAAEAVNRGAAALLVERELPLDVAQIVVDDARQAMGRVAAAFYGYPSRALRVVGVTGTNGKTTTAYLIRSLLERAGRPCGLIGTVVQSTGAGDRPAARTTPEAVDIQRLMKEMVDHGCRAVAMEVSSHGLVLKRTVGVQFDVAVFTNLSQDHFDFHRSFDDYLQAKRQLFAALAGEGVGLKAKKAAVINGDDPYAQSFLEASPAPAITYGLSEERDLWATDVKVAADGVRYVARTKDEQALVRLRLTGRFNVYNSLAALAVGMAEGISLEEGAMGIAETVVPGRFEPVDAGQDFAVIVDYAHTPDSLENVLRTARSLTKERVICVVGAGGDRDRTKRPIMGQIAAELSDYVVITSDNPRSEDPAAICREVAAGAQRVGTTPFDVIVDRREGIRQAISVADTGDLVLITGKGHETYQEIMGEKLHFDDREEAKNAIRERL